MKGSHLIDENDIVLPSVREFFAERTGEAWQTDWAIWGAEQ
jgi:hypothetical protein